MLKKSIILSLGLSIVGSVASYANNYWWENEGRHIGSCFHNYNQQIEKQAFDYAKKASNQNSHVKANVWLHDTFPEGPNTAFGLVRTQNQLADRYHIFEDVNGSLKAQALVMQENKLSEDDLLGYALMLSVLDR